MASPLTPMLEQYHRIKRDHQDAILMFRMGDFYEMFFDDAVDASRMLEIALTARGRGTENEAPMCGVPHQTVDSYIARLIAHGRKVAVCDQVEDPKAGRGLVRREVVRVVSPGTVIDPAALDARDNLYIACLCPDGEEVGAAFIDLSTGEFRVSEPRGGRAWERIALHVATLRPREILQPAGAAVGSRLDPDVAAGIVFTDLETWAFARESAYRIMTQQMATASLMGFGCHDMTLAVRAGGALLQHLKTTQRSALSHIHRVVPLRDDDHMVLDPPTQRTLELTRSLADGSRAGTLLSVLDRTLTSMGARRLQAWLLEPLLHPAPIDRRLDAVEELTADASRRQDLRGLLRGIKDVERLLGRVTLGACNARDLVSLRDSLERLPALAALVATCASALVSGRPGPLASTDTDGPPAALDTLEDIHRLLARAIADEPAATLHEGGMIRAGYDARLDELRSIQRDGRSYIAAMEARERQRSGITSLKVRYNKIFGYYIEVSRANLSMVPSDYERRQTLVGAERFVTPELKEYEEKVLGAQERIHELEYELFVGVRDEVGRHAPRVKTASDRVAELDALASLADVAAASGYVRPRVVEGTHTVILGGRHPVVEAVASEERFVPNDLEIGAVADARILIVTGPNMGGKSTYLRQTALITLMAQAGSFVPAEKAQIGIVDRIFSRLGTSDNLSRGQSTFMVEMQETANILHNATDRSLILLDEVGRGTSTFDGLSLAWAIVEHLHDSPGLSARVLFATHYHELTELSLTRGGIRNLTVAVKESGQDVVFLRRIVEGAADRSYGIHVARLAGLPPTVIERAREVLANLESEELGRDGLPKLARHPASPGSPRPGQMALFGAVVDPASAEILEQIREADTDDMTPLEALSLLHRMKGRLS